MIKFLQATGEVAKEVANVAEQMSLWELFNAGGWLMWVLLALGGVTIFIFVERFVAIQRATRLDMNFMKEARYGDSLVLMAEERDGVRMFEYRNEAGDALCRMALEIK